MQFDGMVVVVDVVTVVTVVVTVGPVYFKVVVLPLPGCVGPSPSSLSLGLVEGDLVVVPPCTQMYCRPAVLTAFGQSCDTK